MLWKQLIGSSSLTCSEVISNILFAKILHNKNFIQFITPYEVAHVCLLIATVCFSNLWILTDKRGPTLGSSSTTPIRVIASDSVCDKCARNFVHKEMEVKDDDIKKEDYKCNITYFDSKYLLSKR